MASSNQEVQLPIDGEYPVHRTGCQLKIDFVDQPEKSVVFDAKLP